jgi:hypothetical protein
MSPLRLTLVAALAFASPVRAFHRDLPPVMALSTSGDVDLPRVPPQGHRTMVLARPLGADQEIVSLLPFTTFSQGTQLSSNGAEPVVSYDGKTFAWETDDDPLGLDLPGTQIALRRLGVIIAGPNDPSGTSARPTVDKRASVLVFESAGDLTGVGTPGVNRVYVREGVVLSLASTGNGWSGNAMVSARGRVVTFESTSDPLTGADTGVRQVWVGSHRFLPAARVTSGAGASTEPLVSDEGKLVAFSSTADLGGDGHDTGVKQIFIYHGRTQTYAQLTNEASGCGRPVVARVRSDWRIAFVCGGQAYYHMLRENRRYHVLTPGGTVQSIMPEMGVHFVMVSTTADLYGGPTLAGHRIFLRNLFAQAAPQVAGSATWFPYQGIAGF